MDQLHFECSEVTWENPWRVLKVKQRWDRVTQRFPLRVCAWKNTGSTGGFRSPRFVQRLSRGPEHGRRPPRMRGRESRQRQRALRPCSGMSLGRRGGHTPRHADTRHGTRGGSWGVLLRETGRTDAGGQTPRAKRASAHGRRLGGPARRQGQWNGCSQRPGEGREGEGRGVHVPWGRFRFCKTQEFRGWAVVTAAQPHAMGFVPPTIHLKMVKRVSFT